MLKILKALENSVNISDQVLHEKAMMFVSLYKIKNFKGNNEEAVSVSLEKFDEFRKKLQDLICVYSLDDVFNCDEIGLYSKIEPKRTISNTLVFGRKQSKDQIKILLCSNITYTEKLKLAFIHKYKNLIPYKTYLSHLYQ
ncbi:15868_t:CDS:2 [Funneliformis geosporum]|nr:15868_t:CDS:2 [Funneliformis geosporum]